MSHDDANPCLDCGACCANFRVSFYWSDAEARGLPAQLTEQLNPWLSCMVGTNQAHPHCAALSGNVGSHVVCTVYEARPEPCRQVQAGDDQCTRARVRYGMAPVAQPLPPYQGVAPVASDR